MRGRGGHSKGPTHPPIKAHKIWPRLILTHSKFVRVYLTEIHHELTRGRRAVKSLAAERELAEIFVQMVARAKAKEAKKAAALLSQLSIRLKGI